MELEINSEIRLHDFALTFGVAKNKVILDGMIHGSRQIEIDCLIVRRLDVEERFAGMIAGEGGLLLLIHDEEIDIRRLIRCAMQLANKRLEYPMKMRLRGVRRDLKWKRGRRFQAERFLQHDLRCAHR